MFFGYFRGFRVPLVETDINYGYSRIEDWNMEFDLITKEKILYNSIEPPILITDILENICDSLIDKFHSYNDYDEDDWWSLHVSIYPFENRINFKSECKFRKENLEELQVEFSDLPEDIQNKIIEIEEENDLTKLSFDFNGRYGEANITFLEYENKTIPLTHDLETLFYGVVNHFMTKNYGIPWDENDGGIRGSVVIWGDDIFIYANVGLLEWENTNMDINITLENIKDYEE